MIGRLLASQSSQKEKMVGMTHLLKNFWKAFQILILESLIVDQFNERLDVHWRWFYLENGQKISLKRFDTFKSIL